jgi:hypothetical protein
MKRVCVCVEHRWRDADTVKSKYSGENPAPMTLFIKPPPPNGLDCDRTWASKLRCRYIIARTMARPAPISTHFVFIVTNILHTACLRLKLFLSRLWNECFFIYRCQVSQEKQWIFKHITVKYCPFYLFLLLKDFHLLRANFKHGDWKWLW